MKKLLTLILTGILCVGAAFSLSGCKKDNKGSVMNVSLNPEVEFILDKNNKVISVNALNEEGNLVINGQAFVGKTDKQALELFISVSKETGFLVSGRVSDGENEIKIAFSGDNAKKHYNDIKSSVDAYLDEQGISASLSQAKQLTEDYLTEQLKKCAPYIESAKLEAMSYAEKLEELVASRKETAELYSQELKNSYYAAKQKAMLQAKCDYVKTVDAVSGIMLDTALTVYNTAYTTIENARNQYLVGDNSMYQKALTSFRNAKTEYLNYRNYVAGLPENEVTTEMTAQLAQLGTQLDNAETALNNAYTSANAMLDSAQANLKTAYESFVSAVNKLSSTAKKAYNDAESHIEESLNTFKTNFGSSYETVIEEAKNQWESMKNELIAGYQAQ